MSSQREAELAFWRGLVGEQGEFYYAYRVAEYHEKVRFFPSFLKQEGVGADIGCGCISVFEGSSKPVDAHDALALNYAALLDETIDGELDLHCPMAQVVDEEIMWSDEYYSWIACLNMIDHTPNPTKMIQEMHRVLKPSGRIYFEVNLEAGLAAPHYEVWDELTPARMFMFGGLFEETFRYIQDVPEHRQRRYWAELVKL